MAFSPLGRDVGFLREVDGVDAVQVNGMGTVEVTGGPQTPVHVAAALATRGIVPDDYRIHRPTLEDVFLAHTGRRLTQEVPA